MHLFSFFLTHLDNPPTSLLITVFLISRALAAKFLNMSNIGPLRSAYFNGYEMEFGPMEGEGMLQSANRRFN